MAKKKDMISPSYFSLITFTNGICLEWYEMVHEEMFFIKHFNKDKFMVTIF